MQRRRVVLVLGVLTLAACAKKEDAPATDVPAAALPSATDSAVEIPDRKVDSTASEIPDRERDTTGKVKAPPVTKPKPE